MHAIVQFTTKTFLFLITITKNIHMYESSIHNLETYSNAIRIMCKGLFTYKFITTFRIE